MQCSEHFMARLSGLSDKIPRLAECRPRAASVVAWSSLYEMCRFQGESCR